MPLKSRHSAVIVVWRRLTPEKKNVSCPDHEPSGFAGSTLPAAPPDPNESVTCTSTVSPGVGTGGQEAIDATSNGTPLVILFGLIHGRGRAVSAHAGMVALERTNAVVTASAPIHFLTFMTSLRWTCSREPKTVATSSWVDRRSVNRSRP